MGKVSGLITSGLLGLFGALHVYWACAGTLGSDAVLPTQDGRRLLKPTRPMTWAVGLSLFGAMAMVLGHIYPQAHPLPRWLFRWGVRGMGLVFLLQAVGDFRMLGFFKTITGTRFAVWDTWLFSPICLLTALLAARAMIDDKDTE